MDRSIKTMTADELEIFLEKNLPDPATRKSLEQLGLYDRDSMSLYDRRGTGPARVPGGHKAMYVKASLIDWLVGRLTGSKN